LGEKNLIGVNLVQIRIKKMPRLSISFSEPNDQWLNAQVNSQEYSSKSELVNDLIRQARNQQVQIDWIRAKLDKAEQSGFTSVSKEHIRAEARKLING
jgi:antitoxin ParD1/3/4